MTTPTVSCEHASFVADALLDAMLARDVARVAAVGEIARELVALDLERERRQRLRVTNGLPGGASVAGAAAERTRGR